MLQSLSKTNLENVIPYMRLSLFELKQIEKSFQNFDQFICLENLNRIASDFFAQNFQYKVITIK